LTAGTNIVLAKGTGVTGFNDLAAGSQMDLVSAPNATAVTAIQSGLANETAATTNKNAVIAAIPAAAQNAAAVRDVNNATPAANSLGAAVNAAGGGGGGGGDCDPEEIADAVEARFPSGSVTVTSPISEDGKVVNLYVGASYDAATYRLTWTNSAGSWPKAGGTLAGAAVTLYLTGSDAQSLPAITGEILNATGANQQVAFNLTEAQSLALRRGSWSFGIWAAKSDPAGYTWPLAHGNFDISSIPGPQ